MAWREFASRAVLIGQMTDWGGRVAVVLLLGGVTACAQPQVKTRYFRSETYAFSRADRAVIDRIANATAVEVRRVLPGLPAQLELTARPATGVVNQFGATGDAMPPNYVVWTVDPAHGAGVVAIAEKELRATLFHEFHHLARVVTGTPGTIIERAVTEGMATAFERDFAGVNRPWGERPPEGSEWEAELLVLPGDAPLRDWLFAHPDGRRWIGYRTGTVWVDRATAKSGRTSAELVSAPAVEILRLAGVMN
jgi:hypothetical protein